MAQSQTHLKLVAPNEIDPFPEALPPTTRTVRPLATLSKNPLDAATNFLTQLSVPYEIVTPHHIRIGDKVNYYPARGKIYADDQPTSEPDRGLHALEAVLRRYFRW